ncbi:hypothetical protein GCM10022421_08530 [Oceanisphaera sediminis]|uniref:DNA-binding protein n=1 Tax=Oceanisphaera sediminis TaxID=981381 RepID=A0ABP7DFP0_9GAMM
MPNTIGRLMADHLHQTQTALEDLKRLLARVDALEQQLTQLKQSDGDQGWMTIKKAAPLVGMSNTALAQRFRRGVYPEGVVWSMENNRYLVNLRALRDHMARGQH